MNSVKEYSKQQVFINVTKCVHETKHNAFIDHFGEIATHDFTKPHVKQLL